MFKSTLPVQKKNQKEAGRLQQIAKEEFSTNLPIIIHMAS